MSRQFSRTAARLQYWGRLGVTRPSRCTRVRRTAFPFLVGLILLPATLNAQGFRGTATSTLRYLELRPIVQDTVSFSRVTTLPDGSFEFEGRPVRCLTGLPCSYYRPGEVQDALALTQDIGVTTWGYGVAGLSGTFLLRARSDVAGDFTWPSSDDPFDAILAYAQYNRGAVRARLGRQQNISGLGFSGYDGLNLLVEPWRALSFEGYVGRSLMRGTSEPRAEALRGVEDFVIDTLSRNNWLWGAAARWQLATGTAVTARYQRELQGWDGAMLTERAGVDFATNALRVLNLDASLDYDVAFDRIGKAHIRAQAPLLRDRVIIGVTGRRYQPWFDLFTIWGFFSPVAYNEVEARATWRPQQSLRLWGAGGYRKYEDANATIIFGGIETETRRAELGMDWEVHPRVTVDGTYRYEEGYGAFLSSGDATIRWSPSQRVSLHVNGSAFQQIEEFRVGEGLVTGIGGGAELELFDRTRLLTGATMYRQNFENRSSAADWNQVRAFAALTIGFGEDPGAARRAGRIR